MLVEASRARRALLSRPLQRAPLGIAASLLVACSSADPPPSLDDLRARPHLLSLPPAPAASSSWDGPTGCTGRRWISALSPPSSLNHLGWKSAPVFSDPPSSGTLANYHVVQWTGSGDADVDQLVAAYRAGYRDRRFDDWRSSPELLAPDCVIVGPLGSPSVDVLKGLRHWDIDSFRARTGAIHAVPLGAHPVQIAIIDSSPDSDGSGDIPLGASSHGYTMGWIAREMACGASPGKPPAACAAEISTRLALPHLTNETTAESGGYFGTPAQLAEAIYGAVSQWKLKPPPRPRLVMNLSLGWQPELGRSSGGVDAGGKAAPAQTVFEALRHAACHGALIVAAAGNEPGGEDVQPGPTYPAAWQDAPVPGKVDCKDEYHVSEAEPLASEGNPPGVVPGPSLVVAVGGTNHLGRPTHVTRPGSVGRLVAPAQHGAAGDPNGPPAPALTGTSVSAAVLSGAAALLWAHRPDLSPTAVMAQLYSSGIPIQIDPALRMEAYVADHPEVREVDRCSLAAAIAASCGGGKTCPEAPLCTPWRRERANIPPPPEVIKPIEAWLGTLGPLDEPDVRDDPPSTLQHLVTAPWVHPQPEIPPCGSACVLDLGEARLYVSIDPALELTLSDMVLTVRHMGAGGTAIEDIHYAVGGVDMSRGTTLRVDLSSLPSEGVVEAKLTWTASEPSVYQAATVTETIKVLE